MTGSLSPEQRQLLLAGYVLYDLSADEAATLETLLAEDPNLREELAQLQATWEAAHDITPQAPPNHLRTTILPAADLGSTPVPSPSPRTGVPQYAPTSNLNAAPHLAPASTPAPNPVVVGPWRRGWGAAAAVLIVGLSLSNLLLWRALQVAQQAQGPSETLTVALTDPTSSAAKAQVQINPQTLEGSLTVENLPPLEPGMVYVLWTVVDPNAPVTVDDKNAILTTVFTVDEQGRQSQPIDLPSVFRRDRDLIRAVAITQESAEAPQEHLSAPILIQPL